MSLKSPCYHEAGHIFLASHFKLVILSAEVKYNEKGERCGGVNFYFKTVSFNGKREKLITAKICLAGAEAEKILCPTDFNEEYCVGDMILASIYLDELGLEKENIKKEVSNLLKKNIKTVRRIAKALAKKKKLNEEEIKKLLS